jgi:hypothetical protein
VDNGLLMIIDVPGYVCLCYSLSSFYLGSGLCFGMLCFFSFPF